MSRIRRAISTSLSWVSGLQNTAFAPEASALAWTGCSVDVVRTAAGVARRIQILPQGAKETVAVDQRHVEIDHDDVGQMVEDVAAGDAAQERPAR